MWNPRRESGILFLNRKLTPDELLHFRDILRQTIPLAKLRGIDQAVPVASFVLRQPDLPAPFKIREAEHICHEALLLVVSSRYAQNISSCFQFSDQKMSEERLREVHLPQTLWPLHLLQSVQLPGKKYSPEQEEWGK